MKNKPVYYLVSSDVLPEIFLKVVETNKLLTHGKAKTINEAVAMTGISRSAYYKYKDSISPFYEMSKEKIITLYAVLKDEPGVLSNLLGLFTKAGTNILTINQNIPINGIANITITIQTGNMRVKLDTLMEKVRSQNGVIKFEVMASE
ncbi:MAG: ACT domain-containing protein [Eubacteriales bacterium]